MAAFEVADLNYLIVYDTKRVNNMINFNQSLLSHSLGQNIILDEDDVFPGLMHFVLDLYQQDRPKDVDTLGKLRWYMFSEKQLESEKLPPTQSAFVHVIIRSHYMRLVWKSAHLPHPLLQDPDTWLET